MTPGWQSLDHLSSASMVIRAYWVMSDRHRLFGWRREQLGWSVSLCWCEKDLLIMILGRVWVNHLLTWAYSGLHFQNTPTYICTNTHARTTLFLLYHDISMGHEKRSWASLKLD